MSEESENKPLDRNFWYVVDNRNVRRAEAGDFMKTWYAVDELGRAHVRNVDRVGMALMAILAGFGISAGLMALLLPTETSGQSASPVTNPIPVESSSNLPPMPKIIDSIPSQPSAPTKSSKPGGCGSNCLPSDHSHVGTDDNIYPSGEDPGHGKPFGKYNPAASKPGCLCR